MDKLEISCKFTFPAHTKHCRLPMEESIQIMLLNRPFNTVQYRKDFKDFPVVTKKSF